MPWYCSPSGTSLRSKSASGANCEASGSGCVGLVQPHAAAVQTVGSAARLFERKALAPNDRDAEQAVGLLTPIHDLTSRADCESRSGADFGAFLDRNDTEPVLVRKLRRPYRDSAARRSVDAAGRRGTTPYSSGNRAISTLTGLDVLRRAATLPAALQRLLQSARQPLKAAVRHQHDIVAPAQLTPASAQTSPRGPSHGALRPERRERRGGSQPRSAPSTNTRRRCIERHGSVSRCAPIRMVFERGSITATSRGAALAAQCRERRRDRGRVMREVLVHSDAAEAPRFSSRRFTPLNFAKAARRRLVGTPACSAAATAASAFSRLCEPSSDHAASPTRVAAPTHAEPRFRLDATRTRPSSTASPPCALKVSTVSRRLARTSFRRSRSAPFADDQTVARHRAHELVELPQIASMSGKMSAWSYSMFLMTRCAAGNARTWRACRKTPCRTRPLRSRSTFRPPSRAEIAEIARHPADEKAGLEPGVLEYPREHARRRRLAMRAGDREHPFVREYVLAQATADPKCKARRDRGSLPRPVSSRHALPMTTTVGLQSICPASYLRSTRCRAAVSCVLIGG